MSALRKIQANNKDTATISWNSYCLRNTQACTHRNPEEIQGEASTDQNAINNWLDLQCKGFNLQDKGFTFKMLST